MRAWLYGVFYMAKCVLFGYKTHFCVCMAILGLQYFAIFSCLGVGAELSVGEGPGGPGCYKRRGSQ